MPFKPQIKIPATYMRGGTSKGVFFHHADLPEFAQTPGTARDALLMRIIGSPDPYEKQIDGMGGATSSTSKTVIVSKSARSDHDIDYLFGQVAIDKAFVDWSGNCGNLSAAVGPFALHSGLIPEERIPDNGIVEIRIWQANIKKTIISQVPVTNGQVQETGDFELDGVTFPAAEIKLGFVDPADQESALFPTGNLIDELEVPGIGVFQATMITAGIPTVFIHADDINYSGAELQADINNDENALEMFETIRAYGALKMGLIKQIDEAKTRQHTPKIAFVGSSQTYTSSSGKQVFGADIDLVVRALSMGKLHHAMMGTAAVAIATAAAIPGTLVNRVATADTGSESGAASKELSSVCFGHPSGTLRVGAEAHNRDGNWQVQRVSMSRSARILMDGLVHSPPID